MVLTKRTIVIIYKETPGYEPQPGSIDPYPWPQSVIDDFNDKIAEFYLVDKTDGIQYSTTVGTSIRHWSDQAAIDEFMAWSVPTMFTNFNFDPDDYLIEVQDLP